MKNLYFVLLFLAFLTSSCKDDTPYSPEDLGKLYWKALAQKEFNLTKRYWVSIRELNKLIELIPALGKQIDKGALYTESALIQSEKETFKRVIKYTLEENLDLKKFEAQNLTYKSWFKKQNVEVGQIKVTTDFRSKTLKVRLLVVYSNHRWRFLGLIYCNITRTGFEEPEDNPIDT